VREGGTKWQSEAGHELPEGNAVEGGLGRSASALEESGKGNEGQTFADSGAPLERY
jgi:hypothetical protein